MEAFVRGFSDVGDDDDDEECQGYRSRQPMSRSSRVRWARVRGET
jgi:hypothetical protein